MGLGVELLAPINAVADAANRPRRKIVGLRQPTYWEMRFSDLSCVSHRDLGWESPARILCSGDWFKMLGVHTHPNSAKVIEFKTVRDRPDLLLVNRSVSEIGRSANLDASISRFSTWLAKPNPARGGVPAVFNLPTIWCYRVIARQLPDMASNKSLRFAPDDAQPFVGLSRKRSRKAATTLTDATRVRWLYKGAPHALPPVTDYVSLRVALLLRSMRARIEANLFSASTGTQRHGRSLTDMGVTPWALESH